MTGAADPTQVVERTQLAWQRTALSLVVAAVLLGRLTFSDLGAAALPGIVLALALAGWVALEARVRFPRSTGPTARGGTASACLAVAMVALAGTELAAVLLG